VDSADWSLYSAEKIASLSQINSLLPSSHNSAFLHPLPKRRSLHPCIELHLSIGVKGNKLQALKEANREDKIGGRAVRGHEDKNHPGQDS
jgi:hypothetical protein